ncbi:MAG: four helix bundle protein [Phycisphaeraceae bacterium]|nr:four helix bundle protein [Phycisphaeraceae bacterium]
MARLRDEFLHRMEMFCDRVVDVVDSLDGQRRSRRVVDQLMGSGTSVGANVFEAYEAMSKKEFVKCLAISVRELNESRFWLRMISCRNWIKPEWLQTWEAECNELRKVMGTMIARSKGSTS